jgi:RNA polymerase sporulation-specific sigma factor
MLFNLFNLLFGNLTFFSGAYSNNVFPDPLSKEEEEKCIERMINGDKEARSKLILHNLRLVAHIVKKFESTYKLNHIFLLLILIIMLLWRLLFLD